MRLTSQSLTDGRPVPEPYAFGIPDAENHMALGRNLSPHFAWSDLPAGTRSLVLVCHDPDAPSHAGDVNREDREIPSDLPRVDFYHWLLVDLDPGLGEVAEGAFAEGVVPGGKDAPEGPHGTRQGVNDYTDFLAGSDEMRGTYYGYDGPCPPWNDSIPHRYIFTLYALDVERAPVAAGFRGPDLLEAIRPHILDQASMTTTYSLNPRVPA
ncbi:MAG: YbhB/YbcL family Raf kinase inhibitor-like protein [Halorhodospira halophila]|uniref:YbhB/YbcL family Raf kinase inhibitor-like protein n=1 Tax=Halorhodospira TaxID=85108 RepID=UPI001911EA5D|nr:MULTISPECIES: YbhB/YbcL family Raf kinase inhibitor-like protein [Halorhodospira]MBK5935931.1 phospholipid-binding protein [Halorhodospira halophila]MBK5943277.1 phospholipid-binding protein [Halorhodospira halophila]MCC3751676.1 YbhB/YbcL family Raf kinase inhibitor-like protein [Halorhodospira halophila]MCG5526800.1 YbhB/YbcL family Raf kinase inhibitor-like protein [Halorhodospira halophila]MCG5533348.1 YbhB/YbcL family Raf kinase inhibitor-like protein [Halorhodospira sp. 9621]